MAQDQFDYEELLNTALGMSPGRRGKFLDGLPPRQQAYVIRKLDQRAKRSKTSKLDAAHPAIDTIPIDVNPVDTIPVDTKSASEPASSVGVDGFSLGTGSVGNLEMSSDGIESVDLPTLMMTESADLEEELRSRAEAETADVAEILADSEAAVHQSPESSENTASHETKDRNSASDNTIDGSRSSRVAKSPIHPEQDARGTIDTGDHKDAPAAKVAAASRSARVHLLRPHARGSIGEIFVAYDDQLSREVALKRIRPELAGKKRHVTRFIREAAITAQLQHPGIVPIYNLGSHNKSSHYTMPLVIGSTLAEAVDKVYKELGHRPTAAAWMSKVRPLLNRFIAVCNAIDYAHGRQVIHRDLKPSNIMIGTQGQTLVLDWGCAKLLDEIEPDIGEDSEPETKVSGPETVENSSRQKSSTDSVSGLHKGDVTIAGTVLGTVEFMSPEQAAGESEALGPTSDVFGLGATLFNLLTNKTAVGPVKDLDESLAKVRDGKFNRIDALNPLVPGPLIAICERSMQVRPEERYQTAGELGREIDAFLAGEPVQAYAEPIGERFRRFVKHNRTIIAVMLGMLLVGIGSLIPVKLMIEKQRAMATVTSHRLDALQGELERSVEGEQRLLAASASREKNMLRGLYASQMVLATQAYTSPEGKNRAHALVAKWRGSRHVNDVGWEWHNLDQLLRLQEAAISEGELNGSNSLFEIDHENVSEFPAIAWHPDGKQLAVSSGGGVILYTSDRLSYELKDILNVDRVTAIDFDSSGDRVAISASNGSVLTFAVSEVKLQAGREAIDSVQAKDVRVYDGKSVGDSESVSEPATATHAPKVGWSHADRYLASTSADGKLQVWNVRSGEELSSGFSLFEESVARDTTIQCASFSWSPNSTEIALALIGEGVLIVDAADGKATSRLNQVRRPAAVDWSSNGERLAIGTERMISIWNIASGNRERKLEGSLVRIADLSWNSIHGRIAALNENGTVHLWDTSDGLLTAQYDFDFDFPWAIKWSPDGKQLVSTSRNGTIELLETR